MAFTNKSLHSARSGMSIIKGATLFFLGMTCVMFATQALSVKTIATSAIQYISKIVLTASGTSASTTGIYLNGVDGSAYFIGDIETTESIIVGDSIYSNILKATEGALEFKIGAPTKMIINASGNVGIGTTTPEANLEVDGSIKMLSSINGREYSGTSNMTPTTGAYMIYFPQGTGLYTGNAAVSADTIWYVQCLGTGSFGLNTYTGEYVGPGTGTICTSECDHKPWNNASMTLWGDMITYNLPAGETFGVWNGCTSKLQVYYQIYGQNFNDGASFILGGTTINKATSYEAHAVVFSM